MTTRRVAVVQAAPSLFDLPETLRRFEALLAEAASADQLGVDLVDAERAPSSSSQSNAR
ncbi:MAG: hypothetical protein WBA97_31785 [Actinophytocola sp.]|uniref:hypothetical protein n=1 Tax=Actinophytocola sp. TaxID=1872138 RepID=UPI003C76538A